MRCVWDKLLYYFCDVHEALIVLYSQFGTRNCVCVMLFLATKHLMFFVSIISAGVTQCHKHIGK